MSERGNLDPIKDKQLIAGLQRSAKRLIEFGKEFAPFWAEFIAEADRELKARCLPCPNWNEPDGYKFLARIIEPNIDSATTRAWTAGSLYDAAIAWAERVRIKAEIVAKVYQKAGDDSGKLWAKPKDGKAAEDFEEFPPNEWVDPSPPHKRYKFGRRRLLWELWRALRQARRRLTPDDLPLHVPKWKDSVVTGENLKQELSQLRKFWKDKGRDDLADRIDNAGGSVGLR